MIIAQKNNKLINNHCITLPWKLISDGFKHLKILYDNLCDPKIKNKLHGQL
jgi:hypothetical protein